MGDKALRASCPDETHFWKRLKVCIEMNIVADNLFLAQFEGEAIQNRVVK